MSSSTTSAVVRVAAWTGPPPPQRARAALDGRSIAWREVATSTDANAAHAVGLPALALGVTTGSDEHTPNEWIDIAPIADGIAVLADTVARYEKAVDLARTAGGGTSGAGTSSVGTTGAGTTGAGTSSAGTTGGGVVRGLDGHARG